MNTQEPAHRFVVDPYYKAGMLNQILPKRGWPITAGKPANPYAVKEIRCLQEPAPPRGDPVYREVIKFHVKEYFYRH